MFDGVILLLNDLEVGPKRVVELIFGELRRCRREGLGDLVDCRCFLDRLSGSFPVRFDDL